MHNRRPFGSRVIVSSLLAPVLDAAATRCVGPGRDPSPERAAGQATGVELAAVRVAPGPDAAALSGVPSVSLFSDGGGDLEGVGILRDGTMFDLINTELRAADVWTEMEPPSPWRLELQGRVTPRRGDRPGVVAPGGYTYRLRLVLDGRPTPRASEHHIPPHDRRPPLAVGGGGRDGQTGGVRAGNPRPRAARTSVRGGLPLCQSGRPLVHRPTRACAPRTRGASDSTAPSTAGAPTDRRVKC